MLNREQAIQPDLQLLCGARDTASLTSSVDRGTFGSSLSQILTALHQHHNFDAPSLDVFLGLHAITRIGELVEVGDTGTVCFEDLAECVRTISDLDSLSVLLEQLDSPGFALWCGANATPAREQLISIRQKIDKQLKIVRSMNCHVDVIASAGDLSTTSISKQVRQASITGVPVRTVQLLESKNFSPKQLKKWTKRLTKAGAGTVLVRSGTTPIDLSANNAVGFARGRALKPGTLLEIAPSEYLYVIGLKRVGNLDIDVGIVDNRVVIDYQGVRRFMPLPAACSRMQAHNVTLSSEHITIYFTVKEDLWPSQENLRN